MEPETPDATPPAEPEAKDDDLIQQQADLTVRLVNGLNENLMAKGVELIEHASELAEQERDQRTQAKVNKFLSFMQHKALEDQITTTNLAIGQLQHSLLSTREAS